MKEKAIAQLKKLTDAHSVPEYEDGVTLAVEYVQKKNNKITTIPKLLEQLEIRSHVLTLYAMGTQTKIVQDIMDKEADYILVVKCNQGSLHQKVLELFHIAVT